MSPYDKLALLIIGGSFGFLAGAITFIATMNMDTCRFVLGVQ